MAISKYYNKFSAYSRILALAGAALMPAGPAMAQADLLVAPTRVVMNGGGSTEVILDNIGPRLATYRISLELRRMNADGDLVDVPEAEANATEKAALALVRFSPRRISLPPNQPQSVRIVARAAPELPDGEYRVHMLFRGVPDPTEAVPADQPVATGLSIRLVPIYGITIPLIVRKGQLEASAALDHPRLERQGSRTTLVFDLTHSGPRSLFGELFARPRSGEPVLLMRGIAIYPEVPQRRVDVVLSSEQLAKLRGPVRLEYREPSETGGALIAAVDAIIG
jgi:P pilus assembly chaperone PapD